MPLCPTRLWAQRSLLLVRRAHRRAKERREGHASTRGSTLWICAAAPLRKPQASRCLPRPGAKHSAWRGEGATESRDTRSRPSSHPVPHWTARKAALGPLPRGRSQHRLRRCVWQRRTHPALWLPHSPRARPPRLCPGRYRPPRATAQQGAGRAVRME